MRKIVILFLVLFSVTGFALDCTGEITEAVTLDSDFDCSGTDLIINADFNGGVFNVIVNSLVVNSTYQNIGSLIITGNNGEYSLNDLTGNFDFPVKFQGGGKVNASLTTFYFDLSEGGLTFEDGTGIAVGTLVSPFKDVAIIKQVTDSYTGNYTLVHSYGSEVGLLDYSEDDGWGIVRYSLDNVLINSDGNFVIVPNRSLEYTNQIPRIELTFPVDLRVNKSWVELDFAFHSNNTVASCDLYINGDVNKSNIGGKFNFSIEPDGDTVYSYYWNVSCTDVFGNQNVSEQSEFSILNDTQNPGLSIKLDPNTNDISSGEKIKLTCTAEDNVDVINITIYDDYNKYCSVTSGSGCAKEFSWVGLGSYVIRCDARDSNGNLVSGSKTITVAEKTSSPSTPAKKAEEKIEEKKEEKSEVTGLLTAEKDELLTFEVNKDNVAVNEIILDCDDDSTKVTVSATELGSLPEPEGTVHSYIEINATVSDDNITSAKVRFVVFKSWLEENGITKDDIVLLRYSGEWQTLPTIIFEEKDEYIEFEATSLGFSVFAVSSMVGIDFGLAVGVLIIGVVVLVGIVKLTKNKPKASGYNYNPHQKNF
jgi:PGF-pre-PGF domain-containing protein